MSLARHSSSTSTIADEGPEPVVPIYSATYSGIPVFEMLVNGVSVMRRRQDSCLNATQILKVAGVDKSRRTKVLEREILPGEHEKVQGGYGKYQGTWIPFERGIELCKRYGVYDQLLPLLSFDIQNDQHNTPTKEQAMASRRRARQKMITSALSQPSSSISAAPQTSQYEQPQAPLNRHLAVSASLAMESLQGRFLYPQSGEQPRTLPASSTNREAGQNGHSTNYSTGPSVASATAVSDDRGVAVPILSPNGKTGTLKPGTPTALGPSGRGPVPIAPRPPPTESDAHQQMMAALTGRPLNTEIIPRTNTPIPALTPQECELMTESHDHVLDIFMDEHMRIPSTRSIINYDVPIDEIGNTALHWAAALGNIRLVKDLIDRGANCCRGNYSGETALIRAVLVTNNSDNCRFSDLLELLYPSIVLADYNGRTVLHHIALTADIKGRAGASSYYMATLLEWLVRRGEDRLAFRRFVSEIVNARDSKGDTALNIASKTSNRSISQQLLDIGADENIPNRTGLRPTDFGVHHMANDFSNSRILNNSGSANQRVLGGPFEGFLTLVPFKKGNEQEQMQQQRESGLQQQQQLQQQMQEFHTRHQMQPIPQQSESLPEQQSTELQRTPQAQVNQTSQAQLQPSFDPSAEHGPPQKRDVDYANETTKRRKQLVSSAISSVENIEAEFQTEINQKQQVIDSMVEELRNAHVRLNMERERLGKMKDMTNQITELRKSSQNLDRAITEEDDHFKETSTQHFDEVGAFDADQPFRVWQSLPIPVLEARIAAYQENSLNLKQIASALRGRSANMESKFRKVVSQCAEVPEEKVDELLPALLRAVESDPPEVDLTRVSTFLKKVE